MSNERRDITAQHFAGAVLDPSFYDQVFHGKYTPVPFCKLTRRAWSVDLARKCLVFNPQNGQPKQYVASNDKSPDSWKNFCEAHLKGMNPIFRHFHDEYLVNKSALNTEFLNAWSAEINKSDPSVSYESLQRHFLTGDQNIDGGVENDLYVRDWLYDMKEVDVSFIKSDDGDFYYTDEFIQRSLLDSYVTFIYLYEPWLFMDAHRKYKVSEYTKLWVQHYGFKSPNSFKALLRERFDNLEYVKDDEGDIRLPFGKPFAFAEKVVFTSNGENIDFEAKLTMCTATQVRKEFLQVEKAYTEFEELLGVDPERVWKVYPMHFSLKHYDKENNTPIRSESMFFYTNVPTWAALKAELFTDAVSWAINANGAELAIENEQIKRAFKLPGQGDIDQVFVKNIALLRLGLKQQKKWRTEPYSWPSNVLPLVDAVSGEPIFVDKDTGAPLRFLRHNEYNVEYKNTPKWPYHCVYETSDGTSDYLLAKHAVIEREVKQFYGDTQSYLISHGPVENQEYLLQHRGYLFGIEEPLIGFILFEFWALQKLDNPDIMREVNFSVGLQETDVEMEDAYEARPLTFEETDSPDVRGNQFQFTHQLYHGLYPYVLDNTRIGNSFTNRKLTREGTDFLVDELARLENRMHIDDEDDDETPEDKKARLVRKIEALQNIERQIKRKCTSDYNIGPHYYYNVPLSSIGKNLNVLVNGENITGRVGVKHWALGSHTSCVFRMEYNGNSSKLLADANNCAVTRVSTYEEMHELFDVNNAGRPVAHQTQPRPNLSKTQAFFDNFQISLVKTGPCAIPGIGDTSVDRVKNRVDLRMFPKTRVIGPPQMFQAPGMWGFVNSFLRFPHDTGASAMLIKDRNTNDSCVLLAFDNMKYLFVSNNDVQGDKFTLRQINSHEQNDYDVLQLIRQSGGFEDISRTPGGNRFFMRAFKSTQDSAHYEPIATEKLASDRYYASNDGQHRMAHTFYDGSSGGSKSECIGCFVRVVHPTSVPGKDFTSSGMDGTCYSSAISKRLELIKTPGGDTATHGIDGLWQCWYCNQRRETVANIDVRDGENFSFSAMHNMS